MNTSAKTEWLRPIGTLFAVLEPSDTGANVVTYQIHDHLSFGAAKAERVRVVSNRSATKYEERLALIISVMQAADLARKDFYPSYRLTIEEDSSLRELALSALRE